MSAGVERPPRWIILVALALGVIVAGSLVAARLARPPRAGPPPPIPTAGSPTPATPLACRLPLVVTDGHASAAAQAGATRADVLTAGFVTPGTGAFQPDPSAVQGGQPFPAFYANDTWRPTTYDPVARRWLPVAAYQVAPDHSAYAYVVARPLISGAVTYSSMSLHVYDLRSGADRVLWTRPGSIDFPTWDSRGIHLTTTPAGGGVVEGWTVDPATGAATDEGPSAPGKPQPADFPDASAMDGGGADGGPNPSSRLADGDRLWATSRDGTALWLWSRRDGLRRFPLDAGPQGDMYVTYRVAGPCV